MPQGGKKRFWAEWQQTFCENDLPLICHGMRIRFYMRISDVSPLSHLCFLFWFNLSHSSRFFFFVLTCNFIRAVELVMASLKSYRPVNKLSEVIGFLWARWVRLRFQKFWECPRNLLEYHFGEKALTSHVELVKLVVQLAISSMCYRAQFWIKGCAAASNGTEVDHVWRSGCRRYSQISPAWLRKAWKVCQG